MASPSKTWGTELQERRLAFPCDHFIKDPDEAVYRGVTIYAGPEIIFRWLSQLRVAPYSYDWIDNLGRRSPDQLIPGLDQIAIGQSVMSIFKLVDFARDEHFTIRTRPNTQAFRVFGDVAVSYLIIAKNAKTCRLLAKVIVKYPRGIIGWLMRTFLPWGDLIMMRRQLLNIKKLAERMTGSE